MLELPLGLLLAALLARGLGPGAFGQYSVALAAAWLATTAASLGVEELVQRDVLPQRLTDPATARAGWRVLLGRRALALSVIILLGLAVTIFEGSLIWLVVACVAVIQSLAGLMTAVANGLYAPGRLAIARVAGLGAGAAGSFGLDGLDVTRALALSSLPHALSVAIGGLAIRRLFGSVKPAGAVHMPLAASVQIGVQTVVTQVLGKQTDILVGRVLGQSASNLGGYNVAFTVGFNVNQALVLGLGAFVLPAMSGLSTSRVAHLWRELMVATSVLSAVPLALCFGLASPLLGTVFGAEYERFAPLLMAVVIGQWVLRLAGVGLSLAALYALHEEAYVLRASALAAAVNIGLDCILIPLLGMYGAVVATALAATLAGALLQRRLTLRTTAKWPTRQLAQLTVASVLLAVGALIAASTASWRGIPIVLFSLAIWAFSMHRAAILEPITRRIPRRIQT